MHHQSHLTPIIVTDGFPPTVSVVAVTIHGRPWGVVSRTAVEDTARHAEIMKALVAVGIATAHIREVLHGVRS